MTDYTHIPLHIRCTERWKIDPAYPEDGCTWWRGQAQIQKGDGSVRGTTGMDRRNYREMTPREIELDTWLQQN